ncbi:hypothetical protein KsCSTR_45450 [Candidatus Kuenenia stuttgartiensis]|uniref:Uncharacterized protein n=1 Tax=Kuenenia stuttgartiensis TaxID=174633 RepID=Q1PWI5_KUEST|nr:hypothetical protein KsCSTR_45450 [Candidatus Kuenenia stuttgartiensis]CAJ71591.1 unknown protein [Candidatus Kuenenia stuttgartiensis]
MYLLKKMIITIQCYRGPLRTDGSRKIHTPQTLPLTNPPKPVSPHLPPFYPPKIIQPSLLNRLTAR